MLKTFGAQKGKKETQEVKSKVSLKMQMQSSSLEVPVLSLSIKAVEYRKFSYITYTDFLCKAD